MTTHANQQTWIEEGEMIIVPRGVEHCPVAEEECHVLLFEPMSTLEYRKRQRWFYTKESFRSDLRLSTFMAATSGSQNEVPTWRYPDTSGLPRSIQPSSG